MCIHNADHADPEGEPVIAERHDLDFGGLRHALRHCRRRNIRPPERSAGHICKVKLPRRTTQSSVGLQQRAGGGGGACPRRPRPLQYLPKARSPRCGRLQPAWAERAGRGGGGHGQFPDPPPGYQFSCWTRACARWTRGRRRAACCAPGRRSKRNRRLAPGWRDQGVRTSTIIVLYNSIKFGRERRREDRRERDDDGIGIAGTDVSSGAMDASIYGNAAKGIGTATNTLFNNPAFSRVGRVGPPAAVHYDPSIYGNTAGGVPGSGTLQSLGLYKPLS